MPSLPSNIDLTENQDFKESETERYIKGSYLPISATEGKIAISHVWYDHKEKKYVKAKIIILPWYTWKYSEDRYDHTELQTLIEQDAGVRFDGDIEDAFVFGTADEREDQLYKLESFRAECLGHFCYRCGKLLETEREKSICLCDHCHESIEQDKVFKELDLHRPNYENIPTPYYLY